MASSVRRKRKLENALSDGAANDGFEPPANKRQKINTKNEGENVAEKKDVMYIYAVYSETTFLNIDKAEPDPWFSIDSYNTKSHSIFSSAKEANKCAKDIFKRNEPDASEISSCNEEDDDRCNERAKKKKKRKKQNGLFDKKHKPVRTGNSDENQAYARFHCWVAKRRVLHKY